MLLYILIIVTPIEDPEGNFVDPLPAIIDREEAMRRLEEDQLAQWDEWLRENQHRSDNN